MTKIRFKIREIVLLEQEREIEVEMEEPIQKGTIFDLDKPKDTDFLDALTEKINNKEFPSTSWYLIEQIIKAEVL